MADKKISALTSLAQGDIASTTDVLAIVDTSATETKKATPAAIVGAAATAGLTNVDINSGAIDGTTVGASSASSGAFTTLSASSTVTLSGGTANGVLYLNGSKEATSGSALTFDGSQLVINSLGDQLKLTRTAVGSGTLNIGGSGELAYASAFHLWYNAAKSTEWMRLDSSGNVGIGTSSPGAKLGVNATAPDFTFLQSDVVKFRSGVAGTTNGGVTGSASGDYFARTSGGKMLFSTDDGVTAHAVIDSSGNLGIGTSSPSSKLHVSGTGTYIATFNNSSDDVRIELQRGGTQYGQISASTTSLNLVGSQSNTAIKFLVNGGTVTAATIDSSGNLGLGVTPSAWDTSNSIRVLQYGAGSVWSYSTTAMIHAQNSFSNSSGVRTYVNNGYAAEYEQASGQHIWKTAASGTAGTAISFTTAMTLDASGRLLVGMTSGAIGSLSVQQNAGVNITLFNTANDAYTYLINDGSGFHISNSYVASAGFKPITFSASGSENARITNGGYFKASNNGTYVSSTGAYHEFRQTASDWAIRVSNTNATPYGILIPQTTDANNTGSEFLYCQGAATVRASIRSNGGLANYQSNNVDLSDIRTKKDITPAASMWDKIGALEIVTYKYNDQTHDDVNVGVIAQQVESVEPVWVDADGFGETPEGEEPLKTVYTKDITFAAIKALQEAMTRIEELEAKVAALEAA